MPGLRDVKHLSVSLALLRGCRLLAILAIFYAVPSLASVTVLVGEPYGSFGTMMPTGHTAIYLDHLCADGPLKLRECVAGETQGVVIARYHQVGEVDWLATPVMQFLYATDKPEDVLRYADIENTWDLRQNYRRKYLEEIVPDGTEFDHATIEWWESLGTAYTRRLWGYRLRSTRDQDLHLMEWMNQRVNHHAYRLGDNNCANFAAEIVNFYFPRSIHTVGIADFNMMTPKNVARCVEAYGKTHPESDLQVFEVPQIRGSLRRSRPLRGVSEASLKTKRYLFTLIAIQPEVPLVCAIIYLDSGRWRVGQGAQMTQPETFYRNAPTELASQMNFENSKSR